MKYLYFLVFFIYIVNPASGQEMQAIQLYGTITDAQGESKYLVHIINKTQNIGTISNKDGHFKLHCFHKDTIQLSSLGHKTINFIVPKISQSKYWKNFNLAKDTVNLAEMVIYPFPATAAALKDEILNNPPESENEFNLHLELADINPDPIISEGFVIKGPFTKLYEAFSRHAKFQKKYYALIKADNKLARVAKIYNSELVRRITGLKDENEIIRFMEFCDLEPEYILNSSTYELYAMINSCFEEFVLSSK